MNVLDRWTELVRRELGLPDTGYDKDTVDLVLDTARDVAHGVARPAAPLTAYLLGLAVGRTGDGSAAELAARISQLAAEWADQEPTTDGTASAPAAPQPPGAPAADLPSASGRGDGGAA